MSKLVPNPGHEDELQLLNTADDFAGDFLKLDGSNADTTIDFQDQDLTGIGKVTTDDIESTNMPTVGGVSLSSIFLDSSWTGSSNITTLGTISTGTWNATAITVPYGGTGLTSLTQYRVPIGNGTSAFTSDSYLTYNTSTDKATLGLGINGITDNVFTFTTGGTGWQYGLRINDSSGNHMAFFSPQNRTLLVGTTSFSNGIGTMLMVGGFTENKVVFRVQATKTADGTQTEDLVRYYDTNSLLFHRINYANQYYYEGNMYIGGKVNAISSMDRLQGAGSRYTVTTSSMNTYNDSVFDGYHTGIAASCLTATTGYIEIDFNPYIGWTANTASGYTYVQGRLVITFYSANNTASTILVESYRPSGGTDSWMTWSSTTTNTNLVYTVSLSANHNYSKKMRISFYHPTHGVGISGISFYPDAPESVAEQTNIPRYTSEDLILAHNSLSLTDSNYVQRTKFASKVANGATALAYLFDTENDLSTSGAKIASFKNQGTEKAFVDTNGFDAVGFSVGGTAGIDKSITVLDADGTTTHALTFTKGILTACVTT
jgi:hypothetical protein